jgi:Mce-associated membrane protein
LLAVTSVLAAASVLCAAWFGWSWYSAAHSGSLSYARTRDAVLASAQQAVLNFNTLDYRSPAPGLRLWLASSTGSLHTQISQNLQQEISLVKQRKTITTARVLDIAVTQLDVNAGTATVMAAVNVTVTGTGQPFTEHESELGSLTRTASGWKLSALGYPQGASGATPSVPSASAPPSHSPSPTPSPTPRG